MVEVGIPDAEPPPTGLGLLRKLGTFVVYGVFRGDVTADWSIIGDDKEVDVRGA